MAREGAGHVVAISRSGKMTEQLSQLELEMAQLGTKFHLVQCDASKQDDVADVFRWMKEKKLPTVRGVFHCAMVLQVSDIWLGPLGWVYANAIHRMSSLIV